MNSFKKLKNLRTLLVDDDELIRDALSIAFRKHGCFLLPVETAEEGLQALAGEHFDIIISDFRLPGMDGLEFLKQSAALQPGTMNVLITAYRDQKLSSEIARIVVHEIVEKPYALGELITALVALANTRGVVKPAAAAPTRSTDRNHKKIKFDNEEINHE